MAWKDFLRGCRYALLPAFVCCAQKLDAASGCVWKVTAPDGGTLYLGGSVHALRSTDYPLPPAYNRAFESSTRIAFEVDRKALLASGQTMIKAGQFPKGDSLKNHVDPRTYDYVRRVFALMRVPEDKIAKCRPWLLVALLEASNRGGRLDNLGIDAFLLRRAQANSKTVIGLESLQEHVQIFAGLTDRQSEALLLLTFIPQATGEEAGARLMQAWRSGDVDAIARMTHEAYGEFPFFANRLLDERNRNWLPKIERELHSGRTCFVVVGAAHLGGPAGVLRLLRDRGYKVEQL